MLIFLLQDFVLDFRFILYNWFSEYANFKDDLNVYAVMRIIKKVDKNLESRFF